MNKKIKEIEESLPSKKEMNELSLYQLSQLAKKLADQVDRIEAIATIQELKGQPKLQHLFKTYYQKAYARISDSIKFEEFLVKNLAGGVGYIDDLKGDNAKARAGFPLEISRDIIKKAALQYFAQSKDVLTVFTNEVIFGKLDEVKDVSALTDTFPKEAIWFNCIRLAKRKRGTNSPAYSATLFKAGAIAVIKKDRWQVVENAGVKRWVKI